jgi:hypothetical protein
VLAVKVAAEKEQLSVKVRAEKAKLTEQLAAAEAESAELSEKLMTAQAEGVRLSAQLVAQLVVVRVAEETNDALQRMQSEQHCLERLQHIVGNSSAQSDDMYTSDQVAFMGQGCNGRVFKLLLEGEWLAVKVPR